MSVEQFRRILEAIRAEPQADDLRLIAADWFEEHGNLARAEFIRAQLQLARTQSKCGSESGDYLCRSMHCQLCPLIRRQNAAWLEMAYPLPLPFRATICAGPDQPPPVAHFRRGFVQSVQCNLNQWLHRGPALVAEHPIELVQVVDRVPVTTPLTTEYNRVPVFGWYRRRRNCDDTWSTLPSGIFDFLPPGMVNGDYLFPGHSRFMAYPSASDARAVLSHACLAWAFWALEQTGTV